MLMIFDFLQFFKNEKIFFEISKKFNFFEINNSKTIEHRK